MHSTAAAAAATTGRLSETNLCADEDQQLLSLFLQMSMGGDGGGSTGGSGSSSNGVGAFGSGSGVISDVVSMLHASGGSLASGGRQHAGLGEAVGSLDPWAAVAAMTAAAAAALPLERQLFTSSSTKAAAKAATTQAGAAHVRTVATTAVAAPTDTPSTGTSSTMVCGSVDGNVSAPAKTLATRVARPSAGTPTASATATAKVAKTTTATATTTATTTNAIARLVAGTATDGSPGRSASKPRKTSKGSSTAQPVATGCEARGSVEPPTPSKVSFGKTRKVYMYNESPLERKQKQIAASPALAAAESIRAHNELEAQPQYRARHSVASAGAGASSQDLVQALMKAKRAMLHALDAESISCGGASGVTEGGLSDTAVRPYQRVAAVARAAAAAGGATQTGPSHVREL